VAEPNASQSREVGLGDATAVSVVVPVYNGAATLGELTDRLLAVLEASGRRFEIILVDDGSRDGSAAEIDRLAAAHVEIRGIQLMRNFGQHNATLAGIRDARNPVVVTLDDDLQHPPEAVPQLLDALASGYDVVYASAITPAHGLWRGLATSITKLALSSAMGSDIARKVSPFRAFRCDLRNAFAGYTGPQVSIDVLLSWATTSFALVPFEHRARAIGRSNYTLGQLVRYALTMMTGFSTRPLRLASVIGFVFGLFGVGVLVEVVVRRLVSGNPVPGFPFIASIVSIFAGAQLFALGIIGEYLARMHFRMMDKPPYAIRRRIGEGGFDE
jgi:glycosyltransferase involved in cell wall biosynthesis